MKKILLMIALTVALTTVYGQKSIDALFDKYAGKDGFVTVTINGDLLKLIAAFDDEADISSIPASVTGIRILTQEDDNLKVDNFFDAAIKGLDLSDYEEFMSVKESDQDVRMLVRSEGREFREFLLIAGGKDNAVIQIKGNMSYKEAKRFSDDAKKNHGVNIMADRK